MSNRTGKTWCRHYCSMQNERCKAGIAFDSVRPEKKEGVPLEMPCWGLANTKLCSNYSGYTPEEIKAQDEEIEKHFRMTVVARKVIIDDCVRLGFVKSERGGRIGKSVAGKIPCPCCKTGVLSFSRAAYNGHVHAKCSTPDCVAWME